MPSHLFPVSTFQKNVLCRLFIVSTLLVPRSMPIFFFIVSISTNILCFKIRKMCDQFSSGPLWKINRPFPPSILYERQLVFSLVFSLFFSHLGVSPLLPPTKEGVLVSRIITLFVFFLSRLSASNVGVQGVKENHNEGFPRQKMGEILVLILPLFGEMQVF